MTKSHILNTQEQRRKDIAQVNCKTIARVLKITTRNIVRVNNKVKEHKSTKRKAGSEAPNKITREHKVSIYKLIAKNPFLDCSDIQSRLGLPVTDECIRLHLIKSGFKRKLPKPKLDLSETH